MADQPITTSIDSLVKYLREHGETDTTTLARELSVNEATMVDWADILEKAGMIKITYKVGKMFLSQDIKTSDKQTTVEKSVTQVKKSGIQAEVEVQQIILNEVRAKIEGYSKTVNEAEQVFKEKGKEAKTTLDKITNLDKELNKISTKINSKRGLVDKIVADLQNELQMLQKDTVEIKNYSLDAGGVKVMLDDVTKKVTVYNNTILQLNVDLDRMVNEHRNQLRAMQASAKAEINSLREAVVVEERKITDYERMLDKYNKRSEDANREINKRRSAMLDDALKSRDEAMQIYNGAVVDINQMTKSIKTMKESWGLFATFNDKITAINTEVGSLSKQVDDTNKTLNGILAELKKQEPKSKDTKQEKSVKLDLLEQKAKGMRSVTEELNKKKDDIKNDVDDLAK